MSARGKFLHNLLVTAVDSIKDANGQPGILQVNFVERTVMLHDCSNGFSTGKRLTRKGCCAHLPWGSAREVATTRFILK